MIEQIGEEEEKPGWNSHQPLRYYVRCTGQISPVLPIPKAWKGITGSRCHLNEEMQTKKVPTVGTQQLGF